MLHPQSPPANRGIVPPFPRPSSASPCCSPSSPSSSRAALTRLEALAEEQGKLRLALAETADRTGREQGERFERLRTMTEEKLTELRLGNEAKLSEIQKTVNEDLQTSVQKRMDESFARVIERFAAVQKAIGELQAVTAEIGGRRAG